jgi:hypothetical protein
MAKDIEEGKGKIIQEA